MKKVAFLLCVFVLLTAGVNAAEPERLVGTFHVVWGDPPPELGWDTHQAFFLVDENEKLVELAIPKEMMRAVGGVLSWNNRLVEVTLGGEEKAAAYGGRTGRSVAALRLLPTKADEDALAAKAVTGSQPWVSLLCKFSDEPAEPENLAFFQGMYANVDGGLDHYWRELSYDAVDIAGSSAVNWVTLPNPQSFYIPTPGSNSDSNLGALFDDCTAAADPFVDFSNGGTPFVGINMMFNDLLDCCAWGGGQFATLDGLSKLWRVTWEPPWGYADEGVIAHEMGHGFGLPHSNNSDNDGWPYDSPWDVMSAATSYSRMDPTYGFLGKHINAYHKNELGWIPTGQRFDVAGQGSFVVTLDHMALASTSNFRTAHIPIGAGNTFYTVEVRLREGYYDSHLPGSAVIIHHVDPARSEPSWVVDAENPPADFADTEGVMWRVGETFADAANSISVEVLAATADGYQIRISSLPDAIFVDGFESGSTSAWSAP